MIAVRRYLEFLTVTHLNFGFSHQFPGLIPAPRVTQAVQRLPHATTAVGMITRIIYLLNPFKHFFMLGIRRSIIRLTPVVVITRPVHTQHLTHQADRVGILMLGDKRVFHFVSAAKNTVAFFRISFSI